VHRLDRGTTGLLVIAKSDEAHRRLSAQLAARTLKRTYAAIAWGRFPAAAFTIDEPIARNPRDRKLMAVVPGGKEARTHVTPLLATDLASSLQIDLETGRTHQIRVHLRHLGQPIVGDPDYGGRRRALRMASPALRHRAAEMIADIDRPALHARRLRFDHPFTNESVMFESPLPEDFLRILARVEAERPPEGKIR
ncbi:MAG: RluA family pseudouridine synthase, partial [Gemmatimonadetes bacterium]|nr:RluA family pseudouridine synthase [Gemmatimonadota bacterium]